ncbi:caspase-7 (C14 family) [Schistosoma mansoni]|nr:caspase-7 (C14 family) [Schistosoma mansoni]|eukprot:XP_018644718.1 caspase-7 (C14 family) [Schistosoma mansoni]
MIRSTGIEPSVAYINPPSSP